MWVNNQVGPRRSSLDDADEKLYYTIINLDMSNFTEMKRMTGLEMEGKIDQEGLSEFVKAHHTFYDRFLC